MTTVGDMLSQIATNFHASVFPQFIEGYPLIVAAMVTGLVLHFLPHSLTIHAQNTYSRFPLFFQAIILAIVILVVIQVRQSDIVPFIYLQY